MKYLVHPALLFSVALTCMCARAYPQTSGPGQHFDSASVAGLKASLQQLETKLDATENEMALLKQNVGSSDRGSSYAPLGLVLFLFGGVCALWAQGSGRNAIAWFFIGVIFSVLAIIAILVMNANEQRN